MKKVIKVLGIILIVLIIATIGLNVILPKFSFVLNSSNFSLQSKVNLEVAKHNDVSGSWWGHNQEKVANIGDVTFTLKYDNSSLDYGNLSISNPYYCDFIIIVDGEKTKFDSKPSGATGIVLADEINNKVYYILTEPTDAGPSTYGWVGELRSVMHEYDFDAQTKQLSLVETHIVTPNANDGKQRQGAAIDENGNIAIAYGSYNAMMNLYTYEQSTRNWEYQSFLSNETNDSIMYCRVAMKDLDNIYILGEQDTNLNGTVYYLYVKFFAYEEGTWTSKVVVDYREDEEVQQLPVYETNDVTVVHTCDLKIIDNKVHISTIARDLEEVNYITYEGGVYTEVDLKVSNSIGNLKVIELDGQIYCIVKENFISNSKISVINYNTGKVGFSYITGDVNNYFYINKINESSFNLILFDYSSSQKDAELLYIRVN